MRHRSLAAGLVRLAGRVTWVGFLLGFFGIFYGTSNNWLIRALLKMRLFHRTRAILKMTHFPRTRAVLRTQTTHFRRNTLHLPLFQFARGRETMQQEVRVRASEGCHLHALPKYERGPATGIVMRAQRNAGLKSDVRFSPSVNR